MIRASIVRVTGGVVLFGPKGDRVMPTSRSRVGSDGCQQGWLTGAGQRGDEGRPLCPEFSITQENRMIKSNQQQNPRWCGARSGCLGLALGITASALALGAPAAWPASECAGAAGHARLGRRRKRLITQQAREHFAHRADLEQGCVPLTGDRRPFPPQVWGCVAAVGAANSVSRAITNSHARSKPWAPSNSLHHSS